MNTDTTQLPTGVHFIEYDWPTKFFLRFPRLIRLFKFVGKIRLIFGIISLVATTFLLFSGATKTVVFGFIWVIAPLFTLTLIMRTKTISRKTIFAIFSITAAVSPILGFLSEKVNQLGVSSRTGGLIDSWQTANPAIIAPVMEEIFKIWPLLILPLFFAKRVSRFTSADWLIVTFASGAGFLAFEDSMRSAAIWQIRNHPLAGLASGGVERGIFPWSGYFDYMGSGIASHAVLAGLIGATYGITRRMRKYRWVPVLVFCWAIVDHSAFNGARNTIEFELRGVIKTFYSILGSGQLYVFVFIIAIVVIHYVDIKDIGNPFRQDIGVAKAYSLSFKAGRLAQKSRSLVRQVAVYKVPTSSKKFYLYVIPVIIFWIAWMIWVAVSGNVHNETSSIFSCLFCVIDGFADFWHNLNPIIQIVATVAIAAALLYFFAVPFGAAMTGIGIIGLELDTIAVKNDPNSTFTDYLMLIVDAGLTFIPLLPKGSVTKEIFEETYGQISKKAMSKVDDGLKAAGKPLSHFGDEQAAKTARNFADTPQELLKANRRASSDYEIAESITGSSVDELAKNRIESFSKNNIEPGYNALTEDALSDDNIGNTTDYIKKHVDPDFDPQPPTMTTTTTTTPPQTSTPSSTQASDPWYKDQELPGE